MKIKIGIIIGLFLLLSSSRVHGKEANSANSATQNGSISIKSTPELYELTSKLASEYSSLNPGVKIKVVSTGINNIDLVAGDNLGLISDKSQSAFINETSWKMVVGRDIIVPIINAGNPFLNEILKHGISIEQFDQIFKSPQKQNWGNLLSNEQTAPVHIYLANDETIKTAVGNFIQESEIMNNVIAIGNIDDVVMSVKKDRYGIGFCRLVNVLGLDNENLIENVRLLPIDRNGNGTIDHMEDIYSDLNLFMRGVWIGKYPKALYNNIYVLGKKPPTDETELAFFNWILTDGQQFLGFNGYSDLVNSESQSQLDKINTTLISVTPQKDVYSITGIILFSLAGLAFVIFIFKVFRNIRNKKTLIIGTKAIHSHGFDNKSVIVLQGLFFDKTHTWAFMEKDGNVSIGVDDFLQHITGSITRVEMKSPGEKIKKGDLLFSIIQSGKQLNIYAPVSGTIIKQNEVLTSDSSFINSSPYSDGWVYKIEPSNWLKEIQELDMSGIYKRWLDTEFLRVKDFLAVTLKQDSREYSLVVLQDGGVLKDGVLSDFGPEIWEDFQTNFLDRYK
jgi:glycine cleavage system H lipoate-binding protein/ABC-type phosphate transport system substrate-binding protein